MEGYAGRPTAERCSRKASEPGGPEEESGQAGEEEHVSHAGVGSDSKSHGGN